ncbi:BTAD domain-containing putative transcriptional regulator [Dactylosporangium sp. NPDC048998]|uniref:AfsR/SARP family transcriptional regulator n=1 Tax=Dactylosporangium sp. NPDC048998 TaxID=3363976 RepID=UPI003711C532
MHTDFTGTGAVGAVDAGRRPVPVAFSLLGPFRCWAGGQEVDLGAPQQRALLATLLLHDGVVTTVESLIDALWGTTPPRSGVTVIRTYISRLRQVIGDASPSGQIRIDSMAGGYAVRVPPQSVDVVCFRRLTLEAGAAMRRDDAAGAARSLREALALRHGLPLTGLPGPYVQGQRARLQQLISDAEVSLVEAEFRLGRYQEVLPDLRALLVEHPLRERLHELFMAALYRLGRQADALTHYQVMRQRFVEELGIEPGARLRDLHRQILLGGPNQGSAEPARMPGRRSVARRRSVSAPYGGRTRQRR